MTFWWIVTIPVLVCILTDASIGKSIPPKPAPIIDGTYAKEYEFPYIVAIRQDGFTMHGDGVILDEHWILTARHVAIKYFADNESYYFNFTRMNQIYVYPKFDNNISSWYLWPNYRAEKLFCAHIPSDNLVYPTDSDLALIKLADPILLGNESPYNLQKAKIYQGDMSIDYRDGYDIRVAAEIPNRSRLQYTREDQLASYLPYRPCQQIGIYFPNHCPCLGDSGGPAVVTTVGTGEEYLFGILSWVSLSDPPCADLVFVQNLGAYTPWIDEVMNNEEEAYKTYNCDLLEGKEYNVPVS
ncbi:mite allergen Eur m 3-like [Brevipalpus obovatus]|uniref:mite allergen Eur m 3-like n=1 Tax=Brevipalpus obovatus TaxID=246614 RepID=UPI003D9EC58E